jgi:hypothetical protein
MWRLTDDSLAAIDAECSWSAIDGLASFAPHRPHMTLTLNLYAAPGADQWSYRVGTESGLHGVAETYVACGYLVRDGRPAAYAVDLPLMLSSTITLTVMGAGLDAGVPAGLFRVLPARLEAPGVAPLMLRPTRAARLSETAWAIEFALMLLQKAD